MKLLSITKPGIIFGNVVTVCGGFFMGSQHAFHPLLLIYTLIGMAFVIACGCVVNNVYDRDIDGLMERTKNRPIAQGLVAKKIALPYAAILGIAGLIILYYLVNPLTMYSALLGLFFYAVIYTMCCKRHTVYGIAIGGISGSMPPVVGYSAATNHLDIGTLILFLILFFWQMPHFYAIAINRLKDFKAASIPVLPLKKGVHHTKIRILIYVVLFTITAAMPTVFGYLGYVYLVIALFLGVYWFYLGVRHFKMDDDRAWARKMFFFSIILITVLSLSMMVKV